MPELYAGPLVRWYRQEYPGSSPLADPPSADDVATLVARWQAAFAPAVGAVSWPEDAPGRSVAIAAGAWAALLADAAAPRAIDEARAARPREVPGYPLLQATAWIPASFDGVLPIGLPDQPEVGALASLDRLAAWIRTRRLQRWAAKVPRGEVDGALDALGELAAFATEAGVPLLVAE